MEVSLTLSGELAEPAADILARYAPGGVALSPSHPEAPSPIRLQAYLPETDDLPNVQQSLERDLWYLSRIQPFSPAPNYRWLEEEDWAETWKAHYGPLPVGQRFLIQPAWLEPVATERIVIRLDPGMAFGSGTHPSTQLSLIALEETVRPGDLVADLGSGSGILSIAAVRLGAGQVLAYDIDPLAVDITRANAGSNQVDDRISAHHGSLDDLLDYAGGHQPPNLIVANILAPVLAEMLGSGLSQALANPGVAILAGILDTQEQETVKHAAVAGLHVEKTYRQEDWVALRCSNLKPTS